MQPRVPSPPQYLVTEFVPGGDLFDAIAADTKGGLSFAPNDGLEWSALIGREIYRLNFAPK